MRNIFKRRTDQQTEAIKSDLACLKRIVRWAESARILGEISEEEFDQYMNWVDLRLSILEDTI